MSERVPDSKSFLRPVTAALDLSQLSFTLMEQPEPGAPFGAQQRCTVVLMVTAP